MNISKYFSIILESMGPIVWLLPLAVIASGILRHRSVKGPGAPASKPVEPASMIATIAGRNLFHSLLVCLRGSNISTIEYVTAVVFCGDCSFKQPIAANVGNIRTVADYIKSFKQEIFSSAEVETLVEEIQSGRIANTAANRREHVRKLREENSVYAS